MVPPRSSSQAARRADARERRVGMRGLERPDARAQPVHQAEVVSQPAEQRLAQVDVRLHEAGQQQIAGGVDHAVVGAVGNVAERGDPAVADGEVALHDLHPVVHGDERGVAKQDRHEMSGAQGAQGATGA